MSPRLVRRISHIVDFAVVVLSLFCFLLKEKIGGTIIWFVLAGVILVAFIAEWIMVCRFWRCPHCFEDLPRWRSHLLTAKRCPHYGEKLDL